MTTVEVDETGGPLGETMPPNPKTQMWIVRFARDGQPREIHTRRSDRTRAEVHTMCRALANETGAPVHFTAGDIGGTYGWRLTGENWQPLWYVIEPQGIKRARRVETCPNGCGSGPS